MKEKIAYIKQYLKTHKKTFIALFIIKLLIKIGFVGYLLLTPQCKAQSTNKMIRSGNRLYNQQKYNNATEQYSKALQKDPKSGTALFNQSDALYQLKEYQKAEEQFTAITKSAAKPDVKSKAYHNLGNCLYKQEKYEESVKAYKECLKLNPSDKDTKYNLMMAMAKLKNNQSPDQKQKDQQDKKDQQQKQDQQNKDQQQNKGQPKEQQDKMSNEEAQRLLEALSNEENKVQQKLEKKKGEPQKVKTEKDW